MSRSFHFVIHSSGSFFLSPRVSGNVVKAPGFPVNRIGAGENSYAKFVPFSFFFLIPRDDQWRICENDEIINQHTTRIIRKAVDNTPENATTSRRSRYIRGRSTSNVNNNLPTGKRSRKIDNSSASRESRFHRRAMKIARTSLLTFHIPRLATAPSNLIFNALQAGNIVGFYLGIIKAASERKPKAL